MPIIFYSMGSTCGFCIKAEQMLHKDIANGKIIKKDAREANGKFQGFPSFICTETGKTHSGLPSSPDELYRKLGVEHYHHMTNSNIRDDPPPTTYCGKYTYLSTYLENSYDNGIILCNITTAAPHILLFNNKSTQTNTTMPQFVKLSTDAGQTGSTSNTPIQEAAKNIKIGTDIIAQEWSKLVDNYFMKLFPCTERVDWGNTPKGINVNNLKTMLLPPQPCSTDNNFYCCPGNQGPTKLGLNWLHIFILVALILFIIVLMVFISRK